MLMPENKIQFSFRQPHIVISMMIMIISQFPEFYNQICYLWGILPDYFFSMGFDRDLDIKYNYYNRNTKKIGLAFEALYPIL